MYAQKMFCVFILTTHPSQRYYAACGLRASTPQSPQPSGLQFPPTMCTLFICVVRYTIWKEFIMKKSSLRSYVRVHVHRSCSYVRETVIDYL